MVDMSFLFSVSIPGDTSFLKPLRELAVKVAEYAGFGVADATELGTAITDEASRSISLVSAAAPIEILFEKDDSRFLVTLAHDSARAQAGGPTTAFECRPEGGRRVCRLARDLPAIEPGG
jgi:hypothetical protein